MKQVTIDIPLDEIPHEVLPREILEKASVIRFLRVDLEGFLLTCHLSKKGLDEIVKGLRKKYPRIRVDRGGPAQDGSEILRISGGWWEKGNSTGMSKENEAFRMLKALGQSQCYLLRSPEIIGKNFRIIWVGDDDAIRELHKTFGRIGVKYNVTSLFGLAGSGDSPVDRLTPQQMRVVRLAHAYGYYEVPRKARTEQLARLLGMDKGTVGEHLRRAEKRIMNSLLT